MDEAGECVLGEADRKPRGEDVAPYGWFADGEPGDREASSPARGDAGRSPPGEVVLGVPFAFFLSSSFLPKRKKSLLLDLSSTSDAWPGCCCVVLEMGGICEVRDVSMAAK